MSCKNCSSPSATCPKVTTTNCIVWEGDNIPCLEVCKGDSLTHLETQIATKLCELIASTDVSTVVIPDCLKSAWLNRDETILNFIQFLLTEACTLQAAIDSINSSLSTFEPNVSIDYKCCSTLPCVSTEPQPVGQAIQNVVDCLCEVKQVLGVDTCPLPNNQSLACLIQSQAQQISDLQNLVGSQAAQIATLMREVNCLKGLVPGGGSCI